MSGLVKPIGAPNRYSKVASAVSGLVLTAVTPAENVRGVVIHNAWMSSSSGTPSQNSAFLSKSSAPAGIADGNVLMHLDGATGSVRSLGNPILVAPGLGLYLYKNATDQTDFNCHLELL